MTFPHDYDARVYAGWLGKVIGVRFGAPVENWTYEEIRDHLGELTGYLREDQGKIFKPDDDTAVPMILIRALQDYGPNPTTEQIAETWLNYLGDQHGTLWWGGYGISTEHTVYQNLVAGIPAPQCGSIAQNGAILAEQIGGQIFSDIWGWVVPDDPARAADLAETAARVSHDRNGVYGGRFIAALVSAAFRERDPRTLIETGLRQIPADSDYTRVIRAMLDCHESGADWHQTYAHLKANFGYDRYPGVCHIIPNAGVVALGLLYGEGDFSCALQITNMAGWDTDCNVGNVGAIMGTAVGIEGIDAGWRDPINDLVIASGVIGTRNILTIPQCVDLFCALGRQQHGETGETRPRYHFRYPGSTSNFQARGYNGTPVHQVGHEGRLQTSIRRLSKKGEIRIFTRIDYRVGELSSNYYEACFTPLVFPGQTIEATVMLPQGSPDSIAAGIYVYDAYGQTAYQGTSEPLTPGQPHTLRFTIPPLTDSSLSEVGIVVRNLGAIWDKGSFHLVSLNWHGAPEFATTFAKERPESGGISQWTRLRGYWRLEDGGYCGGGPGECESYSGGIDWTDYEIEADLVPLAGEHHLVSARVQGALRSYAFGLAPDGQIALYKKQRTVQQVAAAPFVWAESKTYRLRLSVSGDRLRASTTAPDGTTQTLDWQDTDAPYLNGQIGLATWYGGHTRFQAVRVHPVEKS